jgi:hypothetical protein
MIAFASAVTDDETYERFAWPGIQRASEPDSVVLSHGSVGTIVGNPAGSIFHNYNIFLDHASELDRLEALVLVHQDTEIVDPDFCATVREALADPEVAIVGCVGAVGVRSIAYWEGAVTWASFSHRYWEHGGGEFPGLSWVDGAAPASYASTGEVDSIDGFLIVLSPWAVRELRFDESLGQMHGYDFDICCQARAAGKKVVTADLRVVHHHSLSLVDDIEAWIDAYVKTNRKWGGRLPEVAAAPDDWEQRARRAEAEAVAARIRTGEARLLGDAQVRRIERLEGELAGVRQSLSWRVTAPLRALRRRRPGAAGE